MPTFHISIATNEKELTGSEFQTSFNFNHAWNYTENPFWILKFDEQYLEQTVKSLIMKSLTNLTKTKSTK